MKIIDVNAKNLGCTPDFYKALLSELGAPVWHGVSINAVIDSVIYGGINTINPPFTIRVSYSENTSKAVLEEIAILKEQLSIHRREKLLSQDRDTEVDLVFAEEVV